jgi:hypothetical protein
MAFKGFVFEAKFWDSCLLTRRLSKEILLYPHLADGSFWSQGAAERSELKRRLREATVHRASMRPELKISPNGATAAWHVVPSPAASVGGL